ncbi:MAG: sulfotransferase [Candidatus Omnitrophica bacterium]|nr:sulfotransferase [Candidatus Omnitrophota bacterium]
MPKKLSFPDFLGIGAQKAGTNWLYVQLKQHPELYLPPIKEIHYFDLNCPARVGYRTKLRMKYIRKALPALKRQKSLKDKLFCLNYYFGRISDSWYAGLFKEGRGKMTGEITPEYAILPEEEIRRIHILMPDIKIIFILRNPIERSWSSLKEVARVKGERVSEYDDKKCIEFFNSEYNRTRADYLMTLRRWGRFFGKDKILICFFDEISENPEGLMARILNFLGVDTDLTCCSETLHKKIYSSVEGECPERFKNYLKDRHYQNISELAEHFGTYPKRWLAALRS